MNAMPLHDPTPNLGEPVHTPAGAADAAAPNPRRIRSFVKRAGLSGTGQARALETLVPRFVLPYTTAPLDWDRTFGRAGARRVLEIGFGMGDATAQIAAAHPDWDILGVEVHEPGIGALLRRIGDAGLGNLRIVAHDVVEVLEHMLGPQSLDAVFIYFPDPWPKKRHHKRRLIQPAFVARLVSHLRPDGVLHCATDWENYALQMLDVLSREASLRNSVANPDAQQLAAAQEADSAAGLPGFAPRPEYRPLTKFENRGIRLGHGVWDVIFKKR